MADWARFHSVLLRNRSENTLFSRGESEKIFLSLSRGESEIEIVRGRGREMKFEKIKLLKKPRFLLVAGDCNSSAKDICLVNT